MDQAFRDIRQLDVRWRSRHSGNHTHGQHTPLESPPPAGTPLEKTQWSARPAVAAAVPASDFSLLVRICELRAGDWPAHRAGFGAGARIVGPEIGIRRSEPLC